MTLRLAGLTQAAFVVWNVLLWPVLPYWAGVVGRVAEALWNSVTPHGQSVELVSLTPALTWRWTPAAAGGSVATGLLAWNTVLYLTVWSVLPDVPWRVRWRWLLLAIPVIGLWQLGDLLLLLESTLLTLTRPRGYDLAAGLDLWFLLVKFASHLTVLGLRQVLPLLLLGWQWLAWRRAQPLDRTLWLPRLESSSSDT